MAVKGQIRNDIDAAITELEQLADEVRLKLHLAGMDARQMWTSSVEPRLDQARRHAKDATVASKAFVDATLDAVRDFARAL